ncbi:hypothetical protein [Flavobacterium adhaerens]|uniref:hypothetical protein n=1 Tax=Flavobacterium adhaerens TaxID=3149043 RepID=UPI0032B5806D
MLHNKPLWFMPVNTTGHETISSLCKIAATANAPTQSGSIYIVFWRCHTVSKTPSIHNSKFIIHN